MKTSNLQENRDSLFLQISNQIGIVLVTRPLTGFNYMSSSRAIELALGAKVKLWFYRWKMCET